MPSETMSLFDLQLNAQLLKDRPSVLISLSAVEAEDKEIDVDVSFSAFNGVKTQNEILEILEIACETLRDNGAVSSLEPLPEA